MFHALHDGEANRRVEFLEMFLDLMHDEEDFQDKIWWSNEACFKLNGHINHHNCTYRSQNNSHVILEKKVNILRITIWAAMSSNAIIDPIFFDASVTGKRYLNILHINFFPQVHQQEDIYFQQNGAPAHYTHCVHEWLDINFNDKWIGRRRSSKWPVPLPDLPPMDFF